MNRLRCPALTSRTPPPALLVLLPLGELGEGLGSLLKLGDEELDVVQDVVQDLLRIREENLLMVN